ncbi:MAG: 2'-5' RNA ligase family protein [Rhodoferax sp.]|nr:2'-5' RNA ligase family protein [Rhodoferax sp.]
MLDQLNLFGGEGGPPQPVRPVKGSKAGEPRKRFKLFFAIPVDADVAAEISKRGSCLDAQYGIHGNPLRPDRLHITLHVWGEYDERPDDAIAMAKHVGDLVQAASFDVVFDRAMTFNTASNPYVLRVSPSTDQAIRDFWLNLGMEIANVRPFREPSFTPHMTLSYKGNVTPEHPIEPIRWTAREFVLINSHVGKTYHEHVGRWSLRT